MQLTKNWEFKHQCFIQVIGFPEGEKEIDRKAIPQNDLTHYLGQDNIDKLFMWHFSYTLLEQETEQT